MKKDNNQAQPEAEQQEQQPVEAQPETCEEPVEEAQEATEAQWREALETAVKQRDEYLDSLRRSQADFQNYKRRNQTASADGYQDGLCDTITAMLPVIDNLERALEVAQEGDPLADGVKMTLKVMLDALAKFGFEEIPAKGEEFDPEKHNAVMRESGDEPGKVLEVFQKGYKIKDRIIRYAMVKVAVE